MYLECGFCSHGLSRVGRLVFFGGSPEYAHSGFVRAHVCGCHRYHTKQGTSKNMFVSRLHCCHCILSACLCLFRLRAEHSGRYNLRDARLLSPGFDFPRQLFYLRIPLPFDICRSRAQYTSSRREKKVVSISHGVHARRVDSSTLVFSLSSHRYPYTVFVFSARFNDS